jgi:hypothetical protein
VFEFVLAFEGPFWRFAMKSSAGGHDTYACGRSFEAANIQQMAIS